jgi:hypothetical protein
MYRLFRNDPFNRPSDLPALLGHIDLPLSGLCLTTAAIKDHHQNIDSIRLDYIDFDSMYDLDVFLAEFKKVFSDHLLDLSKQRSRLRPKDIRENLESFNNSFSSKEPVYPWYRVMPQFLSAKIEGPAIKIEDKEVAYFAIRVNYNVIIEKYGDEEEAIVNDKKVLLRNLKEFKNYIEDDIFCLYFRVVKI